MFRHFFYFLSFTTMLLFVIPGVAGNRGTTLDLQGTNLPDAIRLFAGFLNINVVISPAVKGSVTLHLQNASSEEAFLMLLTAHGLSRTIMGGISYIAPRSEMIKQKQEEVRWQTINNETVPLTTQVIKIRYAKVEDIGRMLQNKQTSLLSKRGRMSVDARTNLIYVKDTWDDVFRMRKLIERLDIPVPQISIEARLVNVDSDCEQELGINFSVLPNASPVVRNGYYSLAIAKLADGSLLDVKLAALEKAGHAELISSPGLFTANQQQASIEAGEEVPYQEVSESGGTAIVFKKAVLGLKVTPQVLPDDRVLLQLQLNQDRPSNKLVLGMPTISTRQIMTSVLARNGQTVVLGGIYETNVLQGQQGLPFVSRIPLLGILFTQRNIQKNKRELLIFVTPKIMNS